MTWGEWFRGKGTDMKWLAESPTGVVSRCDRHWGHVVSATSPRLMVDSSQGPLRKRGRGKRHEYVCVACALQYFGVKPPPLDNQERMFG